MSDVKQELGKLAVLDAVCHALNARRKELKDEASDYLLGKNDEDGTDRLKLTVNGAQVGTLSITQTKAEDGVRPVIDSNAELERWFRETDGGADAIHRLVTIYPDEALELACADGELPDGCRMESYHVPARRKSPMLRVDAKKVNQALGGELPSAVMGFLTEGE